MARITAVTGPKCSGKSQLLQLIKQLPSTAWPGIESDFIIRQAMNDHRTKSGRDLRDFHRIKNPGENLPDHMVIPIIRDWLKTRISNLEHFVMAGAPRSFDQALALSKICDELLIVNIDISLEELLAASKRSDLDVRLLEEHLQEWKATIENIRKMKLNKVRVIDINYAEPYKSRVEVVVKHLPIPPQHRKKIADTLVGGRHPVTREIETLDEQFGFRRLKPCMKLRVPLPPHNPNPLHIQGASQQPLFGNPN